MKCLITGSNGQVGKSVTAGLNLQDRHEILALTRAELDISNRNDVNNLVSAFQPDVIINTAAMTNVDLCESEVDNAFLINAAGVRNLMRSSQLIDAHLIHISTDFVFDGESDRPYSEYDLTNPLSVYAKSKLGGDIEALSYGKSTVLRPSWVFGNPDGDFFKWVINGVKQGSINALIDDQVGTPTHADDISRVIQYCMSHQLFGLLNVANYGETTRLKMGIEVCDLLGIEHDLAPIKAEQLNRPAPRPNYSALSTLLLKSQTGIELRTWQEALKENLSKY